VDVKWFPDNGLAPFLTGPAIITFNRKGDVLSWFTKLTGFFHIPDFEVDWEKINNGEVFEISYRDFWNPKKIPIGSGGWAGGAIFQSLVFPGNPDIGPRVLASEAPFFFEDVNFDGTEELIITEKRGGQRGEDSYKVYSIDKYGAINSRYDITNSMPYVKFDAFTKFNPEDKTITLYSSGGACGSVYETYQGVVEHRGVKFRLIKRWEYSGYYDDNKVPCYLTTYDIVNGREVLNLAESGLVN
jgi:hypothetical protein